MPSYDKSTGKGSFRHPICLDAKGYGIIIGFGLRKFSRRSVERVLEDLDELIKLKPSIRNAVRKPFEPQALNIYFRPLEKPRMNETTIVPVGMKNIKISLWGGNSSQREDQYSYYRDQPPCINIKGIASEGISDADLKAILGVYSGFAPLKDAIDEAFMGLPSRSNTKRIWVHKSSIRTGHSTWENQVYGEQDIDAAKASVLAALIDMSNWSRHYGSGQWTVVTEAVIPVSILHDRNQASRRKRYARKIEQEDRDRAAAVRKALNEKREEMKSNVKRLVFSRKKLIYLPAETCVRHVDLESAKKEAEFFKVPIEIF